MPSSVLFTVFDRFLEERQGWAKFAVNGKLSELVSLLSRARALNTFAGYTVEATALEDIFLHIVNTTTNNNNTTQADQST